MPFRVAYSWSLCENLIPSIKPEVHNTSQRRQRRAEPWPSVGLTSTYRPIDWTCNSGDKLADRQTHRRIERYAHHCTTFTCRGWTRVTKCTLLVNNATQPGKILLAQNAQPDCRPVVMAAMYGVFAYLLYDIYIYSLSTESSRLASKTRRF